MEYKSEIFEVIHQSATANFEIGAISAARMREYDEACLVQRPETVREALETVDIKRYSPENAGTLVIKSGVV